MVHGGWTQIREQAIAVFSICKSIEYLTLLNRIDNYLPLVLSIYSVIFKTGRTDEYFNAMFHCWSMFFCYRRHHYKKVPLIWLSNVLYWKSTPLFELLVTTFNAVDEYPVENFHSLLRSQTNQSDDTDLTSRKAKARDSSKATSATFSSSFLTPKNFTCSSSTQLKL